VFERVPAKDGIVDWAREVADELPQHFARSNGPDPMDHDNCMLRWSLQRVHVPVRGSRSSEETEALFQITLNCAN
jgi:hypothetical protein